MARKSIVSMRYADKVELDKKVKVFHHSQASGQLNRTEKRLLAKLRKKALLVKI